MLSASEIAIRTAGYSRQNGTPFGGEGDSSSDGLATTLLLEGKSDSVVEIEKPTIEIIDQRNNTRYQGQTLTQVKDFLAKKYGIRYKTAADIKRVLDRLNLSHLLAQTPRSVLSDYVPTENQQAVFDALTGCDRQLLLGE